ncbi:MAG TPA: DEAD/DEAH box helicase [Opitutales bacterium]|nr:DEAD/DEAH box helicase [Opitutales bacterium]
MDLSPTTISIHPRAAASLRLRLLLPPNFAVSAERGAIPVKLELVASGEKPTIPEKISRERTFQMRAAEAAAYAKIEDWCGGTPAAFLQLNPEQLRELLKVLSGEPVFFFVNRPNSALEWKNDRLPGVSEHLVEKEPEKAEAKPEPKRRPESSRAPRPEREKENLTPMTVDGSVHFLAISLPSREDPLYQEALQLVKMGDFILEPSNRKWWLRDRHKTLVFLAEHLDDLRGRFRATFTPNFERNFAELEEAEIVGETTKEGSGFELELAIRADGIAPREIQESLQTGRPYLERNGKVILLPKRKLEKLEEVRSLLSGASNHQSQLKSVHRLPAADLVIAGELLDSLLPGFTPPAEWRERAEALRNISKLAAPPLSEKTDSQLRLYQRIGVAWMHHLYNHDLAGILADEMGLGKTIQALCLIEAVRQGSNGNGQPALVVCPASLVENWYREAARFVPDLKVFLHYRDQRIADGEEFWDHDLIITSYSTLIRDQELFREIDWRLIIADEAQHIKNRRTQNARAIRSLRGKGRFILTGTPIENSLDDLVSLFAFLMPGYLSRIPTEARGEDRLWHENRLRKKAAPYILRRTKEWVAPELPEKIEQTLVCAMEPAQRTLYEDYLGETRNEFRSLEKQGESDGKIRQAMFVRLLRLRQICCDPRLVDKDREPDGSAKLGLFREVLDQAIDNGSRMLVFSQFVSVLRLLAEDLEEQGIPFSYLDGQTRNRLEVCDRFNEDPSIPVFLISLKAGGTGLNLTGADTVVHFDPWWNPAVERQATDRAHRIGQTKVVTSIKLIAAASIEEKVLALQRTKAALLEDLFDESQASTSKVTLSDLAELLD